MSYQLHCPNCATAIPSASINIQQTIAVCPNCDAVFNFADKVSSTQKIKRRKAKQPDYITKTETDSRVSLKMPLLTSNSYKWGIGIGGVMTALLYIFMMGATISEGDTAATVIFSAMFLPIIIGFLGSFFVQQTIAIDTETLEHNYHVGMLPIYNRTLPVEDISDVVLEESTTTRETVAQARYNIF
ncbi:MAG: hypothetical protein AAFR67_17965, partial [Chloroflexota bacterium]